MRHWIVVVACVALGACEQVVALDLPEGKEQLVVEARIEHVQNDARGTQRIRLTTTDAYFSDSAPPPATGAAVSVIDDAGRTFAFAESRLQPGVYNTNAFRPEVGRRYMLRIDYKGERYEATDTLLATPPIDALYFAPQNTVPVPGSSEGVRATIDFQEPGGVRNYYLWDQYVNGERMISSYKDFPVRVVGSDEGRDGRMVTGWQPYDGKDLPSGVTVLMRQMSLSESAYRYYRALSDQSSNDGSPFAVPLGSVRSNIANITNPKHRPLGYFMASDVSEAQAFLPVFR